MYPTMYPVLYVSSTAYTHLIRTIQCFNVKTSSTYQMVPVYTTNRRVKAATRPMNAQCSFIYDVDPMPIKNPLSVLIRFSMNVSLLVETTLWYTLSNNRVYLYLSLFKQAISARI